MRKNLSDLPAPELLTLAQSRRKKRDLALLSDYVRLIKESPSRSRMALNSYLMEKYNLASLDGYYSAIKRAISDTNTPRKLVADYNRIQEFKQT